MANLFNSKYPSHIFAIIQKNPIFATAETIQKNGFLSKFYISE